MTQRVELSEDTVRDLFCWEQPDGYEIVEEPDWEDDGKYDHGSMVVKELPTGRHLQISASRTGSYYSDYYYDYQSGATVVEKRQVTKEEWVAV